MSRILPKVNVECPEKVEYLFDYQWEDEPLESYFDDDDIIAEIREQIDEGNMFAWFYVKLTAKWGAIEGDPVYLGACSYKNEADFLASESYYLQELRHEAYDNLRRAIARHRQLTSHFILREQE